jgi:hypothetical protein
MGGGPVVTTHQRHHRAATKWRDPVIQVLELPGLDAAHRPGNDVKKKSKLRTPRSAW